MILHVATFIAIASGIVLAVGLLTRAIRLQKNK